ncbi:MAG: hypothetical protein CL946_12550 [Ectothiorhodospiraceae bacterium]|nr:hypothetical protein [Ectothiorhodospiraceae bacterium]
MIGMTAVCALLAFPVFLQAQTPNSFYLPGDPPSLKKGERPTSNVGVELLVKGDSLFYGGSKGLELTIDRGQSWQYYGDRAPFNQAPYDADPIPALAANGPVIWLSLSGSERVDGQTLQKGEGLAVSTDNGATWSIVPQPMEAEDATTYTIQYGQNQIKALAVTTNFQNITFDIAVTGNAVWTASFAGGLRKSTDGGQTFVPVILPPDFLDEISPNDTLDFDLSPVDRPDFDIRGNLNHRVFSVMATDDNTIWVGTAGGINLSTDGGISWKKFNATNQTRAISGNFVVALEQSFYDGQEIIWAATNNAVDLLEYRAVSYTTDRGATWNTALRDIFTNNFGVKDSIVYAATREGIYRTDNAGKSWTFFDRFTDLQTGNRITDPRSYAAASQGDDVWITTADGLVRSVDTEGSVFGTEWDVERAFQESGSISEPYAYPNPFAPDDEVCRVHYKTDASGMVSIRIYDYAMFPVRTLIQSVSRAAETEHDEIWDGLDDNGSQVANGLYYIQVEIGDNDPVWTKIIVLQ